MSMGNSLNIEIFSFENLEQFKLAYKYLIIINYAIKFSTSYYIIIFIIIMMSIVIATVISCCYNYLFADLYICETNYYYFR